MNYAVKKEETKKASFSINKQVLEDFNELSKKMKLNKSQTITNLIKMFLEQEKK